MMVDGNLVHKQGSGVSSAECMKRSEFESAHCVGGVWLIQEVRRQIREFRVQIAMQKIGVVRAESERQIRCRLCVAAAVQASSVLLLPLLSLLLLGSNPHQGKGDQCRNPRERISQA